MSATRAQVRASSCRKKAISSHKPMRHSAASALLAAASLISVATSTTPSPPTVQYVDPREKKIVELGKLCARRDRLLQQQLSNACSSVATSRKALKRMNGRIRSMQKGLDYSPTIKDVGSVSLNCNTHEICMYLLFGLVPYCIPYVGRSTKCWMSIFWIVLGLCLPTRFCDSCRSRRKRSSMQTAVLQD